MTTKKQLSGLAMRCIEKLKELNLNRFIFTWDIDEIKVADMYEKLSNPILMFIDENCEEAKTDSKFWVYKYEFMERLNNWLSINHFPKMTKSQVNEYMRENYNESNRPSLNDDSKTYRVWVGIKWGNSSHNQEESNRFNHFNQVCKKVYTYRKKFHNPCKLVKMVK